VDLNQELKTRAAPANPSSIFVDGYGTLWANSLRFSREFETFFPAPALYLYGGDGFLTGETVDGDSIR
jgi:hypothetical protein